MEIDSILSLCTRSIISFLSQPTPDIENRAFTQRLGRLSNSTSEVAYRSTNVHNESNLMKHTSRLVIGSRQ